MTYNVFSGTLAKPCSISYVFNNSVKNELIFNNFGKRNPKLSSLTCKI